MMVEGILIVTTLQKGLGAAFYLIYNFCKYILLIFKNVFRGSSSSRCKVNRPPIRMTFGQWVKSRQLFQIMALIIWIFSSVTGG